MSTVNHAGSIYRGTHAERNALETTGLKRGTLWIETDTDLVRCWIGDEWVAFNFWEIASSVIQSVSNYDVRIGQVTENHEDAPGYGAKLYFSGGPSFVGDDSENSDPLWIARYNVAQNETELHVNITNNDTAVNALVIGYTSSGTWYPIFRFAMAKQAHIVDADGTLADITTKFNTLLDELEALGLVSDT